MRRQFTPAVLLLAAASLGAADLYDPKADPEADLARAVKQATAEKKNILIEAGGNWCSWCKRMHAFIEANAPLKELLEKNYVVVRVNFSPENENKAFFSKYPKIEGYPHLFVLGGTGALLHSQDTGELEDGKSYHLAKFTAFLEKWAPEKRK
jgi:thioredoxin-related protein